MDENEIIAFAANQGYIITPRQLERWHKEDLIPRPEVLPPLTFGSGRRSIYPEHTAQQVLAVCRLYEQKRNVNVVRWRLWLEGFPIEPSLLKRTIYKLLPLLARQVPSRSLQREKLAEQQTENVMQHIFKRGGDTLLRGFLRQLRNKADRESMVFIHMNLLYGVRYSFDGRRDEDLDELSAGGIVSQGLGLEAVRFLPKDITADMERFAKQGLVSLIRMRETLETATEEELQHARSRLEMMEPLFECLDIVGYLIGPLRSYRMYLSEPAFQVLSLVFLVVLEKHGYRHNMDVIFETVHANLPRFRKAQELHLVLKEELPFVCKELLSLEQVASMHIEQPQDFEGYLDRLRNVYEQHQTELDAFWQRHPDLMEL